MNKIRLMALILCLLPLILKAQYQYLAPANVDSVGLTLPSVMDKIRSHTNMNDTNEGGALSKLRFFESFWQDRATRNDSASINMFRSYFSGLRRDVTARQSQTCGEGFHGSWRCIGPDTMNIQAVGLVTCLWVDPVDTNYILAGTWGGLFKTTNGGKKWECITDNAPIVTGVTFISWIAVNPLNKNTIYLGTASYLGLEGQVLYNNDWGMPGGVAILKTTDGGQNWDNEIIPMNTNSHADSTQMIQRIYFTPDSTRLYAFAGNKVFTRGHDLIWYDITPSGDFSKSIFTDLEFAPNDQSHFFIVNSFNGKANTNSSILESKVAVPGPTDYTKITTGFTPTLGGQFIDEDEFIIFDVSIPDNNTLYAIGMSVGKNRGLFTYNYSATSPSWTVVNDNIPIGHSGTAGAQMFCLAVSNASTTNNGGRRNIYYGCPYPYHSWDGGLTFQAIGEYDGNPTHADIRHIYIQSSSNSLRGFNDRVYLATDGGVSLKTTGRDDSLLQSASTINISGRGLTCGHFWSVSTSEDGGMAIAGSMHDGVVTYEPKEDLQWHNVLMADAFTTMFDQTNKSTGYMLAGFTSLFRNATLSGSSRRMGATTTSNYIDNSSANEKYEAAPPMIADNGNRHYSGFQSLWTQANPSASWFNNVVPPGLPNDPIYKVHALSINPNSINNFVGYVLYSSNVLYKRLPLAISFTPITVPFTPDYIMTSVVLDPLNVERVWVGFGGNNWELQTPTRNRVRYSPDAGSTWIDISAGLPKRVAVSELAYDESRRILYASTDVGVYRYDASPIASGELQTIDGLVYCTTREWDCFSEGAHDGHDFPNTYVTEMKINYCERKLYASTYGRSIWSSDLYDRNDNLGNTEITSNTTWNTTKYINTDVIVKSGATLTITKSGANSPTIYMPKNGRIIVEPNATLVIDGAKLTNSCDAQWEGIEARGNASQVQTTSNQGFVFIKDAIIEHAKNAIKNWDGANFATTGGIIKVDNSKFLNNSTSISIQHYSYNSGWSAIYKNYAANFTNDTFDINNEFKGGSASPFNEHVSLNHVDGVRFNGCQFLNRNQTTSLKGTGVGIKARDAGFYVRRLCNLSVCTDKCRFTGLTFGIYTEATNNTLYGASVDQAVFDSCTFGIKINKQDFVQVTRDSFIIGRGKSGDVSGTECFKNVGLFVTGTSSPIVQDNVFAGVTNPNIDKLGVIMQSTGEADKQIYHNSFTSLGRGILAINNNKDRNITTSPFPPTSSTSYAGLRILCNSFQSNSKDIHVDANGSIVNAAWKINEGIAAFQGDPSNPAGNTFPTSGITHIDNTGNFINYFYASPLLQPNSNPVVNTTCCAKYLINVNPSCTSRNGTFDLPLGNSQTNGIKNTGIAKRVGLLSALSQYESLLDNGDTEAMKSYINGKTLADSATVRTTLLGLSPYLSDELLKHVANANVLHPGVFAKILIANPDVMRDGRLLEFFLDNHPGLIATEQIADIEDSYDNTTARTTKESQISTLTAEMQLAATQVITNMLLDTVAAPVDSMVAWLNFVGNVNSEYAKASYYAGLGDYTEADNILSDLPTKYTLTLDEETEYNQYLQMWTTIKDIYTDGRTFEQMTTPELTAFTTLHDASIPNGRINVITGTITGIPLSPQWKIPCNLTKYVGHMKQGTTQTSPSRTKANKGLQRNIEKRNVFNVYPNPATDLVTFDFRVPLTKEPVVITITNVAGQTIETFTSETNFGNIRWNTQNISSGVYMYKITTDKLLLETGRVVISK